MLKYNIDFEIMGMILTVIMWIFFRTNYVTKTRSDKAFLRICVCVFAAQVADIATAFTFSMGDRIPPSVNTLLDTAYFLCALASGVAFERYIASYVFEQHQKTVYERIRIVPVAIFLLLILTNPVTRWAFHFDAETGDYVHGPLYYALYLFLALIVMSALYLILRYRRKFDGKQWVSSIAFVILIFAGMILQAAFIPDVYLSFGLIPVSLLMILFSLETPDYRKLIHTLAELEAAREEANRANQVKSDFLANMSHEIRTPINAILGFDEMILRESSDPDTLACAGNIRSSGRTLLSIVNDILDFSKIEAGKMEISPTEYDTARILWELVQEITPRAEAKGLYIRCEVDEALPRRLFGDDVRIRQILTNLLTNAVKYTEKGGVTFCVRLMDASAPPSGEASLFFSVRDTGYGIRPEDREKLFRAFERVDGQRTRSIEGTGLGLPITVRCLELMGSSLEFESEVGVGSDFHFVLRQGVADATPMGSFREAVAAAAQPAEVYRESFTAPDARILVVDDVELNLKVFAGLLKNTQLRIDMAAGGREAIEKLHASVYDCVFLDHQMPGMDGLETLERIRADAGIRSEGMPIIALTANAIAGAREMYLSRGFSDYLTKPIDGLSLSAMLRKWLPQDKLREPQQPPLPAPPAEADFGEEVLEFMPDGSGAFSEVPGEAPAPQRTQEPDAALRRLEAAGLNVSEGMRYAMDDRAFYLEVVGDYAEAFPEKAEALRFAREKGDWRTYEIAVHALKSTSKTVGADALAQRAAELERAAARADAGFIGEKHEAFLAACEALTALLRRALDGQDGKE